MKVPLGPPPPSISSPPPDSNPNPGSEPSSVGTPALDEAEIGARVGAEAEQAGAQAAESSEGKEPPEESAASESSARPASKSRGLAVPYAIPPWSEPPGHPFYFEVLKDGSIIEQLDASEKGAYMFGRVDLCDFVLEHPTISRFHAVLQFRKDGEAFLYDLGSTHGTFLNKSEIKKKVYTAVRIGDIIRFGQSSRLYIFQGPSELMPPEGDLKKLRDAKIWEEMQDREASLLRARVEASMADGISWGMAEDATEDDKENDAEEITWQTYKGQLTERQEKTRGKIIKRMEKVANMRKEIDAIRAKDISQGGLTQGQQTQIARNEQRMSQIMEELESLEETLNESIQESVGARVKVTHGKKKGTIQDEDEDEILSDDDEFYDRTKKKPSLKKSGDEQSVETADTLLDKKDNIIKKLEEKKNLLQEEKAKMVTESNASSEEGDELDVYMTGLSSQLVLDKTLQIQKELSTLQSELDRILYLLKIADPNGEAAKKRDARLLSSKLSHADTCSGTPKEPAPEHTETSLSEKSSAGHSTPPSLQTEEPPVEDNEIHAQEETKAPVYVVTKPQWLGALKESEPKEEQQEGNLLDVKEADQFVDYKDRNILAPAGDGEGPEHAVSGLIIRKRKHVQKPELPRNEVPQVSTSTSSDAETTAADAVALLLKHTRGYVVTDDEVVEDDAPPRGGEKSGKKKKTKRVLGPERPTFLNTNPDYESWVPPEGQSGDGRTSLNDRLGY